MKDINLLVWLTQLGLSVALPPAGFILLAMWLRNHFQWGSWILWIGFLLGVICAVDGFRSFLKNMERMVKNKKEQDPPPVAFNDHE